MFSNQATTITMNKIFKNSYTRLHNNSTITTNRSCKVRCEGSARDSVLTEPTDEMHRKPSPVLEGLVQCSANYTPLTPISFLQRAAEVYRDRTSVVYGSIKYTWEETHRRCVKLASALNRLGVSRGDIVATLAPNVPAMLELHFAVPMAGAIICTLNTRLNPTTLTTLLRHSEAKILFVDHQLRHIADEAINLLKKSHSKSPLIITISDLNNPQSRPHELEYETLIDTGVTEFPIIRPHDENDPISLNYTSGTTSSPKGVFYSHRGAYLNSIACVLIHRMMDMPTYLWTVPMFHCNGWCFTWGVAVVGGTNICLRRVDPKEIFDNIVLHNVTHMGGAPTVLNMLANSPVAKTGKPLLPNRVEIMTGGSPPPPTVLSKIEDLGFRVSHVYGLTETYGPGTWCLWRPEWESLPVEEQMTLKARQGVKHFGIEEVDVKDPVTMESVKRDGKSTGEIMFRGNTVMSGYLKDPIATQEAFAGGWFRSGDLGVKHPDGYIEVKDRLKDIVVSGGENISTVEVESVIYRHPAVLEVGVVARPDDNWGESPCAFVKLKEGVRVDAQEIIQHCRDRMPHFMVPRTVVFDDLPRNSAGKIMKFVLKEKAKNLGSLPNKQV